MLFAESYNQQFAKSCLIEAKQFSPLPDEKENEEFNKLRKMFYTFEVYNPETQKTEYKDFSKLINTDITIGVKAKEIIKECEDRRQDVKDKMFGLCKANKRCSEILPYAYQMLRARIKNMNKTENSYSTVALKHKKAKTM